MAKKIFLIGIGGTGMRCLESFVHTCAMGMYDETEIEMMALDTDSGNGNFKRLRALKNCYCQINGGNHKKNTLFSAKINYYEFSPGYTDNDSFYSVSNYQTAASHRLDSPIADLADVFIDKDVMNMNLKHGYRAQTQMGSMLMYYAILKAAYRASPAGGNSADKSSQSLKAFISSLNSTPKAPVFVFGSVFGGTGASSIPIIPLAFNRASAIMGNETVDVIGNHPFGTIVLTNYFRFDVDKMSAAEVVAKSENFAINSQAALMFYNSDETVKRTYKRLYILGRENKENRNVTEKDDKGTKKTSTGVTGGEKQENPADYIELLAAFAAYHFFAEADKGDKAFDEDNEDKFFCLSHNYGNAKIDFTLFGQNHADKLKKNFGALLASALLDFNSEYFHNIANTPNLFDNVDVDKDEFKALRQYFEMFLYSQSNGRLVSGWLPQMYDGRGGDGLLFNSLLFQCTTAKELGKIKYNRDLYAGDNPPQFKVGLFEDCFSVVKSSFMKVCPNLKTNLDDLVARTYATLCKLYFNETID